jgi:hypothetical protein
MKDNPIAVEGSMRLNRRGESKFGCLLAVVLLALTVYCAIRFVPPYYNSVQFLDETEAMTTRAAVYGWSEKKIHESYLQVAMKYEQPVTEENIKIYRTRNNLTIEIEYILPIELGFYTYNLERKVKYSGLSGSLR